MSSLHSITQALERAPLTHTDSNDVTTYKESLQNVLEWLVEAENTLQIQEDISDNIRAVRVQFQSHEVSV